MSVYLTIVAIGIISTLIMTLFLCIFQFFGISHVNMVSAIGSLVTRTERNAFAVGLILHFITGIAITFLYMLGAAYLGFEGAKDFIIYGSLIGAAHGVFFTIAIVILVAEHHPLEKYRKAGFRVVAVHGCAHFIFGCALGLAAALLDPSLKELSFFSSGVQ